MFQVAYKTDIGLKRTNNQDTIRACDDIKLYIVADGMGGYKGGEIASLMAVDVIEETVRKGHDSKKEMLLEAFRNANRAIYLKACEDTELKGMGTTVSLVLFDQEDIHIAHVGDSRVYFIHEEIVQETTDHTLVEKLVAKGEIDRSEAKTHPKRNVITRAVGSDPEVAVDYTVHSKKETRKILICSDGLTGSIDDLELFEVINVNPMNEAVNAMVQLANDRGGSDNISVLLIEV